MTVKSSEITVNVQHLLEKVSNAAVLAGRTPDDVKLMAVTKTNSAERVNEAINAGITLIGENRVQEYLSKHDDYDLSGCSVHFIGHLQTNKVRSIIDKVESNQFVQANVVRFVNNVDLEKFAGTEGLKKLQKIEY